jgi:hypothetical protein
MYFFKTKWTIYRQREVRKNYLFVDIYIKIPSFSFDCTDKTFLTSLFTTKIISKLTISNFSNQKLKKGGNLSVISILII